MNDGNLQIAYSFSGLGMKNHWKNLFEDRTDRVANLSDEDILTYINQDNYSDQASRLKQVDLDGWIPDLKNLQQGAKAFDEQGSEVAAPSAHDRLALQRFRGGAVAASTTRGRVAAPIR